jgi:hypothetical protein
MPTLRLNTFSPWRFRTTLWPRHRPLIAETHFGPLRFVRVLSHDDALRAIERERAKTFAAAHRPRR